jgi:hypothetical protein
LHEFVYVIGGLDRTNTLPDFPQRLGDEVKKMEEQEAVLWKLIGSPDEIVILIMPVTGRFFVFLVEANIESRHVTPCPVHLCVGMRVGKRSERKVFVLFLL